MSRLEQQIAFVVELDKLKHTLRQTLVIDASRQENSAEHSWHISVMAILLAEHAPPGTDVLRTLKMLLLHDVVEIDAGDTFCYDVAANLDKSARERLAAERLFGLLPADQAVELRILWDEFEEETSADARYAVALDRLQPLLQNFHSGGGSWQRYGIRRAQVEARMQPIRTALPDVWRLVESLIERGCAAGWIRD
jgi:putative hydrolases of HD superfamily